MRYFRKYLLRAIDAFSRAFLSLLVFELGGAVILTSPLSPPGRRWLRPLTGRRLKQSKCKILQKYSKTRLKTWRQMNNGSHFNKCDMIQRTCAKTEEAARALMLPLYRSPPATSPDPAPATSPAPAPAASPAPAPAASSSAGDVQPQASRSLYSDINSALARSTLRKPHEPHFDHTCQEVLVFSSNLQIAFTSSLMHTYIRLRW